MTHDPDRARILICGWAGAGNIGDELLTAAIVAMVRDAGATPVVASRHPAATQAEHGVEAVPWGLGARRAVGDVDGVIVGPGGILQDRSSVWNLPGHLAAALAARRRGLPVAAVGVGAEPLRRRSSARLLRRALRGTTVVTRDESSSDALRAAGVDAVTGVDLVFALDLDTPAGDRGRELVIAVGPSVPPGSLLPASRRLVEPPLDEIAAAVDATAARLGVPVALAGFRGARDRATAGRLRSLVRADTRLVADSVDDHLDAVAGARLVLASRYHAVVLAARFGVPAVVASDEPKLRSLVADIGRPRVTGIADWAEIATLEPANVPLLAPLEPGGITGEGTAAEAVEAVVAAAGARSSKGGSG